MKQKRRNRIVVIFLILMVISILVLDDNAKMELPQCTNGFIDLSKWDFEQNGTAKLDGEWEFYPNYLLTPEEISSNARYQKLYSKVPSRWISNADDSKISDQAVGTYRLKIKTNKSIYMYGLKTTNIRSSSKIFVNGKEVGKSGNPAVSIHAGYVGNVVPVAVFFPSEGDMLDLVIQVANLDYYNGGIIQSIYFGSKESVFSSYFKSNILEMLAISLLLLSGIYYLGIYFKGRGDKRFLYFGIACIAYAFVTATGNEKIFNNFFPFLPFMLILKLRIALICSTIILVSLFIQKISKNFVSDRLMKAIALIMSINIILILAAPIKYMPVLENIIGPSYILVYTGLAIMIFKAIINKEYGSLSQRGAILLLLIIVLIIISCISTFLYFFSMINSYIISLIGLLFILLGTAVLFIKQYAQAYRELEAMSNRLIAADRAKDEFLIQTSHEFKTPLHGIINMAQAILNQNVGSNIAIQKENLTYIISIATRLSSLVNDIIDVESLQNKSLCLHKRVFDINGTIQTLIEILRHMKKSNEIEFINGIPEGQYYVYTDESRFKQIIINLISNSLKYTEKGYIKLKADTTYGYIYISVEDTGTGIEHKVQNKLFKKNSYTGEVNFTDYTSSGLGLSISKMLAENMDGDLFLKWSEPGKGSIFVVKLPEAPEGSMGELNIKEEKRNYRLSQSMNELEERASIEACGDTAGNRRIKILFVDDEVSNIKVLQEIFYEEKYETLIAYNGEKALELIKRHQDISIVLLDVMMPGLSGYEVCKRIRKKHTMLELPVLLLTVRNTPEDINMGLDVGANDFLAKPFDSKELKARVGTLQNMREAVEDAVEMETIFLQSQIKPHFLYNALSIIMSLCYSDGERAGNLLAELSNYLRCSFDIDPHNSLIKLEKELSLVNSYLELEKARFGDRLTVEFYIEEKALRYRIPALTIQPIVENAIRHGIMKRISGGVLKLLIEIVQNELLIVIADDGLGIPAEKVKTLLDYTASTGSIGLKNVNKRLLNEYGQGLCVESKEREGTKVTINIPIKAKYWEADEGRL